MALRCVVVTAGSVSGPRARAAVTPWTGQAFLIAVVEKHRGISKYEATRRDASSSVRSDGPHSCRTQRRGPGSPMMDFGSVRCVTR